MEPEHFAPSWHAAVELTETNFYEPDTDQYRWAGGFSGDGTHIGVCALVDGHRVCVDTLSGGRRLDDDTIQRFAISHLLASHVTRRSEPVELPLHITVEPEERQITIGTTSLRCRGIRIAGEDQWSGSVIYRDVRLNLTTTSPQAKLALRVCADPASLTRTPPRRS